MPPAALVNDLMIFYAPRELYANNATVMEMVCASTCLTSMICFSFESKHRRERAFDTDVHMVRHRMGARGNATSFPLPWADLLATAADAGLVYFVVLFDATALPALREWVGPLPTGE